MKIISGNIVKEAISNHILQSREWLVICTYSTDISPVEYYHFINLIENGVRIELITGKKPETRVISNLTKLFNIALYFSEKLHSKIYINENSVIVTSCNFGRLNIQKYHETGSYFEKGDYPKQYKEVESEVKHLLQESDLIVPMLPFKPDSPIDLEDILGEFFDFIEKTGVDILNLKSDHLGQFILRREFSIRYINTQLSILKMFLMWSKSVGIVIYDIDAISKMRYINNSRRKKIILSKGQIELLMEHVGQLKLQKRLILKMVFFTGLRFIDLVKLKCVDIQLDKGIITIQNNSSDGFREIRISDEYFSDLKKHIQVCNSEYLFTKKNGKNIDRYSVRQWLRPLMKIIGGVENGTRILRNTFLADLLNQNDILSVIQLANISLGSGIRYKYSNHKNYIRSKRIHDQYHPKA